jgi:hypothetical protein
MNKVATLSVSFLLFSCPAVFGQDAMQYGLRHLTVLTEDQKVRVLRYAPHKGDRTPIHSHPSAVVYVLPDPGRKVVIRYFAKNTIAIVNSPIAPSSAL